jgi:hypothetical protein
MMREILFRGKRMSDGEWLYGSLLQVNRKGATECCIHSDRYSHLIDPDTVGQYTGLTDKNGKKIFEGDILQNEEGCLFGASYRFRVEFYPGRFYGESGGLLTIIPGEMHLCEVVGNIHDSPELLEVEK